MASPTLLVVLAVVVAVLVAMVAAGWLTGVGVGLGDTGVGDAVGVVVDVAVAPAMAARRTKAVTVEPVETTWRISQPWAERSVIWRARSEGSALVSAAYSSMGAGYSGKPCASVCTHAQSRVLANALTISLFFMYLEYAEP